MAKTPYELSTDELIGKFLAECKKINVANSGFSASIEVHHLLGALWARLDRQKPPFEPGTQVRIKREVSLPMKPKNCFGAPALTEKFILTINRVWYDGGAWYLSFEDFQDLNELETQYPAANFCLAESIAEKFTAEEPTAEVSIAAS